MMKVVLLLSILACGGNKPPTEPATAPPAAVEEPTAEEAPVEQVEQVEQAPESVEEAPEAEESAVGVGKPCLSDADCQLGTCEGQGCDDSTPGVCMPPNRMCTRDIQLYCGCDGNTFRASGSCPGSRYESRGACP